MTTQLLHIELDISEVLELLSVSNIEAKASEAISESTAIILNRIRQRFLAQVSPDLEPWEPSFAAFKRSFSGRDGGTLFDTGTLFHSIQLYSVSPLEQAIGTDVPYGKFHQFGTSKLPVREFLGFNPEDEKIALNVMLRKIKELVK
jgi:phage gpG-like protein